MLYNKNRFRKINDKKILHKVKKHWVTLSVALLGLLGGGTVAATHASANVNANERDNDADQVNHQVNSGSLLNQHSQLVSGSSANASGQSSSVSASSSASLTPQNVAKQTNRLGNRILSGATQPSSASASNNSSGASERPNTSTAMGGSFSSSVDPAQFTASANTEMDSIVGATNNIKARDKSLRADSSEMAVVSSYDSANQRTDDSLIGLDTEYNSNENDIKRDVSLESSYSDQIQTYTSALSTKASNVDKNYDNTERNYDITDYSVESSELNSYHATEASLTSVINATLSSASSVYQDAARVVVTSNSSADASAAKSAAESSAAASKASSAQSASAAQASTASSIANVSSTDASMANVILSDSTGISSYDTNTIDDDDTILEDLSRLSDVSGNSLLAFNKSAILNDTIKNEQIASIENSYTDSFAAQASSRDLYKNSSAVSKAGKLLNGAKIINGNASLIMTRGINSLESLASENTDSTSNSTVTSDSASSIPSSSSNFSDSTTSTDNFEPSESSSASVTPINVNVTPSSSSVTESLSNQTQPVKRSALAVQSADSVMSHHDVTDHNSGRVNHRIDKKPDVIARVKDSVHWFYVNRTCLAHNNLMSVGKAKNYSMVLHPGFAAKVVKTFTVRHAGHTYYRYEINVKGRDYFVTGNSSFTKNAYVQPSELKSSRQARILAPCYEYSGLDQLSVNRVRRIRRGKVVKIKRILRIGKRGYDMTRLELDDGLFITANRKYIKLI